MIQPSNRIFVIVFLLVLTVSFTSASITCNPSSITTSYNEGDSHQISTQCTNTGNSTPISITGETSIISTSESVISGGVKTINIDLSSSASTGLHSGTLSFGTGYSVPIFFNVESITPTQQPGCFIDVFPTVLSNIKVNQGESKTRNIQLTVPNCFISNLNVQGVILQTDERPLELGELSLGTLTPGSSVIIPIEINAEQVSTGTYSDSLLFSLFNSSGNKVNVPSVSLSVTVTSGINPGDGSFSLSDLPTCSIDAIEMNLNNTHRLTCSNIDPNINVKPIVDNKFINGIGVTESAGQYIYEFKPVVVGNTIIGAEFLFKNAPIGSLYQQEVRISNSGNSPVAGTNLFVEFYQNNIKKDILNLFPGETRLQIIDNSTNSLVQNSVIYINGQVMNNTVQLQSDKQYEIRATAFGYVDFVKSFNLSESAIEYKITPDSNINTNTQINISFINPQNGSVFVDGSKYDNEFIGTLAQGDHEIELIHPDFQNTKFNLTVEDIIFITSGYVVDNFKKGADQLFTLNGNASWSLFYQKDSTSQKEIESSGVGDSINFEPNKNGIWIIEVNDNQIFTQEIQGSAWIRWIKNNVWYSIGIGLLLVIVIAFIFFKDSSPPLDKMNMTVGGGEQSQ